MIESLTNNKIKQVTGLQTKSKERRKSGLFVAEGVKMFMEAPIELIEAVYVSSSYATDLAKQTEPERKKLEETGYEEVSEACFLKMSDTQTPQGILTVLRMPSFSYEEVIKKEKGMYVILEGLQDPGNLGTIMRTAEGAGVTAIIANKDTVDLYNPKTIRSTMGSIYRVPFFSVDNLEEAIKTLQDEGAVIYAAHLKGEKFYHEFDYTKKTGFLIGNEGNGLSDEISSLADEYLKIPMEGKLESLNAAVATAILVYEGHRQRA